MAEERHTCTLHKVHYRGLQSYFNVVIGVDKTIQVPDYNCPAGFYLRDLNNLSFGFDISLVIK